MLPRDISQQIFNELAYSRRLTEVYMENFRDCALQVTHRSFIKQAFYFTVSCVLCLLLVSHAYWETILLCVSQDLHLGECPGVDDSWMDVISSQGSSLLSVDLSGSDVTDDGLIHLQQCTNLQALNFNYCDRISDNGLQRISGSLPIFILIFCLFLTLPFMVVSNINLNKKKKRKTEVQWS